MPKRKSPEGATTKEVPKVTKQEPTRRSERLSAKPGPTKAEAKPKKAIVKRPADDKAVKAKRGKKDEGPAQNGENSTDEVTETAEDTPEEKA